ncbi:hypothetical protein Desaci_0973 [Desulfosporosinus acidiphilus SJ4]|uniref:Flavinylation-associated cytochrome domain-containing protein n=1 Tax=Desulfosporosinus acidiphilus (strain DSM 22704 / JCM 16185 / SJ4) TaxID=646529 RepID=I4D2J4_DESAJ|nr:DUF4405 domain-containing protein [Desulfosporosinus acidiphilus]AFM40018.1 hypothetical protein Desaci_0973 [Desulfosporosinus acidiphilus SJ4]
MLKKDYIKFGLDIIIALIFALLYNTRVFGGLAFHEIMGLGIGVIFLVHVLLNLQWVRKVTRRLFDRNLPSKTRLSCVINVLLLLSMAFTIISGLMISRILFPGLGLANQRTFHGLHVGFSYLTLVIVGVHVGLHGQWIMTIIKKALNVKKSNKIIVGVKVALALVILLEGTQLLSSQFGSDIAQIGTSISTSQQVPTNKVSGQFNENNTFDGNLHGGDRHAEGVSGDRGRDGNANTTGAIITYLGVIGGIAVLTRYFEKQVIKRT